MKEKSIIVILSPEGKVEVSAEGYTGDSCEKATAFIEAALGMDTKGRKKTADWYVKDKAVIKQRA